MLCRLVDFKFVDMDEDAPKSFVSPQTFQKFSFAHFSLFANLEKPNANPFPEADDSDNCSDVPVVEVQSIYDAKGSPTDNKRNAAGTRDPFFSRVSSLSSSEQKSYFKLKKMLMRGGNVLREAERKEYDQLHSKVTKEQAMYLKLLETFCKKNPLAYNLDTEIERYIKELLTHCWEQPLKYSRYYTIKNLVPIISTAKTHISFEHLHSIVQLGQVHHLTLPSMKGSHFLKRSYAKVSLKYPLKDAADNWLKMSVSKDPNARILAVKYGANIVTTLGSLQTLFTNHKMCLENSWEMPVIVTENGSGTDKAKHVEKIVFIDKTFLKTNLTVFEKNLLYHNRALKEALLSLKHKSSVDFSNPYKAEIFTFDKQRANETPTVHVNPTQDLPNMPAAEKHCKSTIEDACSDQSSDSEIGQLFIDELPEIPDPDKSAGDINNDNFETTTDLNASSESRPDVRRSTRLKEKSLQKKETLTQSSPDHQKNVSKVKSPEPSNPCNYVQPPAGWNVSYQLWKIGDLKVLVRCSVTGVSKFGGKNRFWQLAPKLEYQPTHGAQSLTFTEYVHQWISTAVVPNVSLARVRINAFSSKIIGLEELDLYRVVPSQYLVQISECISSTSAVLSKLILLPCGNYLLSHALNEESLNILREVSESERANVSNVYDLHLKYLTANAFSLDDKPENVPWFSIDPDVLLFSHKNACCIPALFHSKDLNNYPKKKKNAKFVKSKTTTL